MKKQLFILSLAAAFVGCSNNIDPTGPEKIDGPSPVSFSAVVADVAPANAQSKVAGTAWEVDDEISIFSDVALKGEAGAAAKEALDYKTTAAGATGTWVAVVTDNTGSWYWVDAATDHTFYACYPATTSTDYETVAVPNIAVQKDEAGLAALKTKYEFMFAQSAAAKKGATVALPMNQIFAAIQFNVKLKENAFVGNSASMTSFALTSANPVVNGASSTINLATGALTNGAAATTLAVTPTTPWALTNTAQPVAALVLPNAGTVSVKFTVDGKESNEITLSTSAYEAGKVYTFDVEFSAALQPISVGNVSITGWSDVAGTPITPVIPN